jgi:hypothetical protein
LTFIASFVISISRTEYLGLLAGVGNSSVVIGTTSAFSPDNEIISLAKSNPLTPPSGSSVI